MRDHTSSGVGHLAGYQRRAEAVAIFLGVLAVLCLSAGIGIMLAAADAPIVLVMGCAALHAVVFGVTMYRAKRGAIRAALRHGFLGVMYLATIPRAVAMPSETPWWSGLGRVLILIAGTMGGFALGAYLTARRLKVLVREGRTDVDLPWALPNEPRSGTEPR